MGCYFHFCSCQEARPSLIDQDIERGNKKREMDDMRREHIKEKGYKVEETWECEWWENFVTDDKTQNPVSTQFHYKRLLSTDSFLAKKRWISFQLSSVQFSCSRGTKVKTFKLSTKFQNYWGWKK